MPLSILSKVRAVPGTASNEMPSRAALDSFTFNIPLGALYDPVDDDPLPAAEILTDAYSASNQTVLGTRRDIMWDEANRFNKQGQNWINGNGTNNTQGGKNDTSARHNNPTPWGMVQEFEFICTSDRFDIGVFSTGAFDMQVYVEYQGKMRKLKDKPLASSTTGTVYRQVKFAATPNGAGGAVTRGGFKHRRVRVLLGGNAYFLKLSTEMAALVYPSPLRPMYIIEASDSYCDPFHSQNPGSDETYFCYGVAQAIFEATGFQVWNAAEGGTGFFQNGGGVALTADTPSGINATRFGSLPRRTKIAAGFTAGAADPNHLTGIWRPLFIMGHGTINDGELSGGFAPMKARCKQVYADDLALDSAGLMIGIHVGPEPYTAINATPPGYDVSGPHYINRNAQIEAIAETPRTYFVDPSNPANPWWTGNKANNTDLSDQQALLTGADNIHGQYRGYYNHGRRIALEIADIPVPMSRAFMAA